MRVEIRIAKKKDNAGLKALTREISMPGWVSMSYLREPDFFDSLAGQGNDGTVIVAENGSGEIIASGARSKCELYVNGMPIEIGYLCGLRSRKDGIPAKTVFRGYGKLKEIHTEKGDVPCYLTTIIAGNHRAEKVLTSGVAPLPVYKYTGSYETVAIPINRFRKNPRDKNIRRLKRGELPLLIEFLNREGSKKQFFPVISEAYLKRLKGLDAESFFAYFADGGIIGAAALWDQGGFKQHLVRGYRRDISIIRPLLNVALNVCGFRALPPPGEEVKELYLAFPCAANNNPEILKAIIATMLYEATFPAGGALKNNPLTTDAAEREYHFLCGAFHEKDPLLSALRAFRHFTYKSSIYLAYWDDGVEFVEKLDGRLSPYLELGTL